MKFSEKCSENLYSLAMVISILAKDINFQFFPSLCWRERKKLNRFAIAWRRGVYVAFRNYSESIRIDGVFYFFLQKQSLCQNNFQLMIFSFRFSTPHPCRLSVSLISFSSIQFRESILIKRLKYGNYSRPSPATDKQTSHETRTKISKSIALWNKFEHDDDDDDDWIHWHWSKMLSAVLKLIWFSISGCFQRFSVSNPKFNCQATVFGSIQNTFLFFFLLRVVCYLSLFPHR